MKAVRVGSLKQAEQSMRNSGRWWEAFDRAAHRVRFWNVRYALRKCLYDRELSHYDRGPRMRPRFLEALRRTMDKAHDMKLSEESNLACCAEQARGAEMMGRIYYEEYEEREWQTIPNPQRWDLDG